jgi:hypothetical protein
VLVGASAVCDCDHYLSLPFPLLSPISAQVVYHVTTLMPNLENEPLFTNKKRHIGNDYVSIVYSDCPDYKQQIVLV